MRKTIALLAAGFLYALIFAFAHAYVDSGVSASLCMPKRHYGNPSPIRRDIPGDRRQAAYIDERAGWGRTLGSSRTSNAVHPQAVVEDIPLPELGGCRYERLFRREVVRPEVTYSTSPRAPPSC